MKKFLIHNTAFLTTGYCEKFGAASFWPGCGKYSIWAPKVVLVFFSQRPQNCNQLFQCWTTCILLGRWAELLATGFSVLAILGAAIVYWILMSNFLFNTVQFIHDEIVGTNDTDTGNKKNISVFNLCIFFLLFIIVFFLLIRNRTLERIFSFLVVKVTLFALFVVFFTKKKQKRLKKDNKKKEKKLSEFFISLVL